MDLILTTIGTLALGCLLGGMVFFPSIVAPTVFQALDPAPAGTFLRRLFPKYYLFIIVTAVLGAVGLHDRPVVAIGLGLVALSTLAVRQLLVPRINQWRDQQMAGDHDAARAFASGHRLSVLLNLGQLLFVIWAFVAVTVL